VRAQNAQAYQDEAGGLIVFGGKKIVKYRGIILGMTILYITRVSAGEGESLPVQGGFSFARA
jgi:hypothetical protein